MSPRITIKDVAKAAGVTTTVVSTVLNNRVSNVRVAPATRQRVLETARRMNYRPSILARSLQSAQSYLIGVAAADVNAAHLADVLAGVHDGLGDPEYSMVVETHRDFSSQQSAIHRLMHRRVEGIITTAAINSDGQTDADLFKQVRETGLPVVEIFGYAIPQSPKVNVDNIAASHQQTQHLLTLGHRSIALLTHTHYDSARRGGALHHDAWDQFQGYETAIRQAGLKPLVINFPVPEEPAASHLVVQQLIHSGYTATGEILQHPRQPTAVLCYTSLVAAGLLRACREQGVIVPGRLSVATNCDAEFAMTTTPALTGVDFPMREIGKQAMRMLWAMIQGRAVSSIRVEGNLTVRASTTPPTL